MKRVFGLTTLWALVVGLIIGAGSASAEVWKFGVMSDTQWTTADPSGLNPNGVSASIIQEINRQFINHGVQFVIQVGDLTENGNDADIAVRAAAAQPLIDAGIGFFPMRGNHETYASPANNYGIPAVQSNFPQTRGIANTFGAKNFSSPTSAPLPSPSTLNELDGMSYSFDYGDHGDSVRFVIIDPWATPSKVDNNADGYAYGYTVNDQQPWISSRLNKNTRHTEHAFVFSHQPLIAENHQDTMFSGYTNANPDWQNAFYASLQDNGVRYYISGHDHIYQRSKIQSPGCIGSGSPCSTVEELICASDSSKFYTPKNLIASCTPVGGTLQPDCWFGAKSGVTNRETSVSQERYTVGFYIFTFDCTCVTVYYYSVDHGNWASDR